MKGYRWAARVALAGLGVLALWAVFVAVVRVLDVPIGGIQPEAFALTAMMTAPITLGAVLLVTLVTAGLEVLVRRLRLAGGDPPGAIFSSGALCPRGRWSSFIIAIAVGKTHVALGLGLAPSQRGSDQRHHLVAGVRPPGGIAQVEALLDEFGQAEMPGQGGRKEQPRHWPQAAVVEGDLDPVGVVAW